MNRAWWAAASIFVVLIGGCASLQQQVESLTKKSEFEKARSLLDEAGAGVALDPQASEKKLAARASFTHAAADAVSQRVSAAMTQGLARGATSASTWGREVCPWSTDIAALHEANVRRILLIDERTAAANAALRDGARNSVRQALQSTTDIRSFIRDSPDTVDAIELLSRRLAEIAAQSILEFRPNDDIEIAAIRSDLTALFPPGSHTSPGTAAFDVALQLEGALGLNAKTMREAATALVPKHAGADDSVIVHACKQRIGRFLRSVGEQGNVTARDFEQIDALQTLSACLPKDTQPIALLRELLRQRGRALVADDATSPLAWLYWRSSESLPTSDPPEPDGLLEQIEHAIANRTERAKSIAIDLGVNVDPDLAAIIFWGLFDAVGRRSRLDYEWQWVDAVHQKPDILLQIESATLSTPSLDSLRVVPSRYFSHYEEVPNPQKSALRTQLDFSRISLDSAEARLQSAISSHNIYPTQFSLANVNSARTAYQFSLNAYNSLVPIYNATPATISRPVDLPYSFREGTVSAGFQINGRILVGHEERSVTAERLDSDFVRFGSKVTDLAGDHRRDDSLDIDVSAKAQVARLMATSDVWADALEAAVLVNRVATRLAVSEAEALLLSWLTSPFGPSERVEIGPEWAREAGLQFAAPASPGMASEQLLQRCAAPVEPADLVSLVVEIESLAGNLVLSRSSGALISPDGLILTCAHGLLGPEFRVRFLVGPLKGSYPAQIVRIRSRPDVALIRAAGIRSDKWLEVDLEGEVVRGDRVVAIGSPVAGSGSIAHLAVTHGEIVTPMGESRGQKRLIADITVASGSSGGPLLEAGTSKIVGVVTAVSLEGIGDDAASSGAFCVATPATMYTEWLGLQY